MPAIVVATVAASQVVCGRENHRGPIEIEIAGQDFWHGQKVRSLAMKFHDASAADAGFISCFRWNLGNEFIRNFDAGTPARAFVSGDSAKLTIVWQPA